MSSEVRERIGKHIAVAREFEFAHLPAFARFIRTQHLRAYVEGMIGASKEADLPIFKYLSHLTDEQIIEKSLEPHADFLRAAEENRLGKRLVEDLDKWFTGLLDLLRREGVMAEDITLRTYIRKRILTSLLPLYTTDMRLAAAIINEIDQYCVAENTAAMNVYLDILSDTIAEQLESGKQITARLQQNEILLNKAQEISNVGHWTWDLQTGKIEWSDNLYRIYGLPIGAELSFEEIIEFNDPAEREKIKEELMETIKGVQPREAYYHIQLRDGQKKILHAKTDPLADKSGLATRVEGVIQDVTERENLVERLQHTEKLYKQAETISLIGNWWWSIQDDTVEWSDEMYRIYGLEPGSIVPSNVLGKYIHPDDKIKMDAVVKRIIEEKEPYDMEYRIVDNNGNNKVLRAKADVEVVDDVLVTMYGTVQDITAQKLAEQALNDYRDFVEKMTNVTPSLISSYNVLSDRYTFVNSTFERLLGYPVKKLMTEGFAFISTIIHPDDLELVVGKVQGAIAAADILPPGTEEPIVEFKYRMRSASGHYLWFHSYTTVFERTPEGRVESIVNVSVDVTAQEEAELSLAKKNKELELSNENLEEYAYVASHDLKEPLRKIATFTDRLRILMHKGKMEDSDDYMERIIGSAKRMTTMVDDLLAVATISGNKDFELCDLNEVLNDAVSSLEQLIEERSAVVHSKGLPKAKVVCSQFRQLFQNLISNSLKFSRPGVVPRITVASTLTDGSKLEQLPTTKAPQYLQISFADNGIGFEEEYAEKVFAMFRRLHGKQEYEGTGIGLSICKKIVENHNGIIYAHGETGKGATFYMVIPQF